MMQPHPSDNGNLVKVGEDMEHDKKCESCERQLGSKATPIYRHSIFSYNQVGGVNNYSRLPGMNKHIIGFRCPFCFHETYTKKLRFLDKIDPQTLSKNITCTVFALLIIGGCLYFMLNSGG